MFRKIRNKRIKVTIPQPSKIPTPKKVPQGFLFVTVKRWNRYNLEIDSSEGRMNHE